MILPSLLFTFCLTGPGAGAAIVFAILLGVSGGGAFVGSTINLGIILSSHINHKKKEKELSDLTLQLDGQNEELDKLPISELEDEKKTGEFLLDNYRFTKGITFFDEKSVPEQTSKLSLDHPPTYEQRCSSH